MVLCYVTLRYVKLCYVMSCHVTLCYVMYDMLIHGVLEMNNYYNSGTWGALKMFRGV